MDKYEYNLKLEEINRLVENENYRDAAKIADTIDWRRVRNARTLCMISEIYEVNDRLEDSKTILMRAYRRSPIGRVVLYRLTEIAIKMKEFDEAVEYYSEFVNAAPNDSSSYVLKYKIYKERGSSIQDQIAILEEYKEKEYTEKWAYELARLYYRVGENEKCIEECDDLVLWFRQGRYVIKALELKKNLAPLTEAQQQIYDRKEDQKIEQIDLSGLGVPELEKVITETVPTSEEEAITDSIITATQKELAQAVTQHAAEVEAEREIKDETWRYHSGPIEQASEEIASEMQAFAPEEPVAPQEGNDLKIEDLQKELASSMREIVEGITRRESDEEIIEPMNDKPFVSEEVSSEEEETQEAEEPVEKVNIDDVLTAMAAEAAEQQEQEKAAEQQAEEKKAPEETVDVQTEEATVQEETKSRPEETQAVEEVPKEIPEEPVIDLSAALEMAAGIADMKPQTQEKPLEKEEQKREEIPQLTSDEQYLFSYFSSMQGLREQIAQALYEAKKKVAVDKTSTIGNIVVTGLPGSGRTTLAIRFAKVLSRAKGEKSARIAKIYAEDFNKKDIPSTIAKIAGGTLIIEEAGDLEDHVVRQLSKAMEFRTEGLVIILEDEQHLLKALFDKYPEFAEKFTSEVSVPIFTNDELVAFGKTYAHDEDYKIDDAATVTLYNRIGEMQKPEHPVTILDVKEIVDQAIKHSEHFGVRKLGMILSKKRYDEDDRIILYEKDFN